MTARKTAQQARLDGTERADRHGDPVSIAPGDVVAPPELSDDARVVWDRYVAPRAALGFYEPAEAPMLGLWCVMMVRAYQANDIVPPGGVYECDDGYGGSTFKKHPAVTALIGLSAEFRSLTARLGLDPVARMSLADLGKPAAGGDGPQLPTDIPGRWTPTVVDGAG